MNILIVDDARAMRMIVRRTLRQAGFGSHNVEEAGNGKEALEAIRKTPPDLVLSDWNMPEMTGIELLRELKDNGPRVPFGFITTEGTSEMVNLAREAGALFVITKPFTPESFQRELSSLLG